MNIAERLIEEAPPPFALGRPKMPVGLGTYTRKLFNKICDGLEASRLLAQSDGQFVLDYIEARRAGDKDRLRQISKEWLSGRQPFPIETPVIEAPQPVEPPVAVTIPDAEATARAYAGELVAGVIPAGRLAKLAAKRFLDDLEVGAARGLTFDSAAAQHVVNYICRLGLVLMPWQSSARECLWLEARGGWAEAVPRSLCRDREKEWQDRIDGRHRTVHGRHRRG